MWKKKKQVYKSINIFKIDAFSRILNLPKCRYPTLLHLRQRGSRWWQHLSVISCPCDACIQPGHATAQCQDLLHHFELLWSCLTRGMGSQYTAFVSLLFPSLPHQFKFTCTAFLKWKSIASHNAVQWIIYFSHCFFCAVCSSVCSVHVHQLFGGGGGGGECSQLSASNHSQIIFLHIYIMFIMISIFGNYSMWHHMANIISSNRQH